MRRLLVGVLLLAVVALLATPFVAAIPTSPVDVTVLESSSRELPQVSSSGVDAQGGNVTEVNIDALSITKTWQGYFGNITGNIHLDDGANQSFYVWGNGTLSGEVYASRNSTISWTTINCTNATQRSSEDSYLGVISSDGDSAINTFNVTTHPAFYVGLRQMNTNSCFSTNLFVNGTKSSSEFYEVLLSDNESSIVYTALIEDDTHVYNGQVADFQLMVGENEHIGNLGTSTYYFFIELS